MREREQVRVSENESVCNKHWVRVYILYYVLVCTVIFAITVKTKDKHADSLNVFHEEKREKKYALRRKTCVSFCRVSFHTVSEPTVTGT